MRARGHVCLFVESAEDPEVLVCVGDAYANLTLSRSLGGCYRRRKTKGSAS